MTQSTIAAGRAAALDLHGELSDAAFARQLRPGTCARAAELYPRLRLLSSAGDLALPRCGAPNKCPECAKLSAVETSEMLALDALEGVAPTLYVVLTTPSTETDPAHFYEARRQFWRAVERRWPGAEFACVLELTTGRAETSGGQRRLHWNYMVKGVPHGPRARRQLREIIRKVWCQRDEHGPLRPFALGEGTANPASQYLGRIAEVGGLMRYLALHFHKETQSPPEGWSGERFTFSRHRVHHCASGRKLRQEKVAEGKRRPSPCEDPGGCGRDGEVTRPGYFGQPGWKPRAASREALRFKRAMWRAIESGAPAVDVIALAEVERYIASKKRWQMVKVVPALGAAPAVGVLTRRSWCDARPQDGQPVWQDAATRALGWPSRGFVRSERLSYVEVADAAVRAVDVRAVALDGSEPTVTRPDLTQGRAADRELNAAGKAWDDVRADEWAALLTQTTCHKPVQETLDLQGKAMNELSRPPTTMRRRSR